MKRKLTLKRETIRELTELASVRGAAGADSVRTYNLNNCATALCNTSYTATLQCPTRLCISEGCGVIPA